MRTECLWAVIETPSLCFSLLSRAINILELILRHFRDKLRNRLNQTVKVFF